MDTRLQVFLAIGAILFLGVTLHFIRRKGLDLAHSILWLFMGIVFLIIAVVPQIVTLISRWMGIEVASNAIFLVLVAFLLICAISSSASLSRHHTRIKRLVQSVALLEHRIEQLEAEKQRKASETNVKDDEASRRD